MSSRARSAEHTQLIRAPAFDRAGRAWKPFRFHGLEQVSARNAQLVRNLEWLLPNVRSTGEVAGSVRQRLHELLEENVSLQTEFVHIVPFTRLRRYVGEPTFLAVLAPHPHQTRGLLEVELGLAHRAIDLLLGGGGEALALRPLTDIEEGVMTYVIIEALKALAPNLDPGLPRLRVEGLAQGFDEVQALIGEDEHVAVVQLRAVFGAHAGSLRLFLPEAVLAAASPPQDAAVRRARRLADAGANAHRLRNVKTWLRVEVGLVEINAGDLAQLRERDVVLVDALSCRPDQGQGGTARLKLGAARGGHLEATVEPKAGGGFRITVTGLGEGPPAPPGLEDQGPTTPNIPGRPNDMDNGAGADLMNDIPLQIAVELGRLPVTAEEVLALKVGHVFDLQRGAAEPVDLSVNGRVVARGELVEVDGNLGVRIVSLAG